MLRNQMLSPIPPHALTSLRQLAEKMEKILLLSLEGFGSTFVEPKVELGARFGHLVCESFLAHTSYSVLTHPFSALPRHVPGYPSLDFRPLQRPAIGRHAPLVV